LPAFVLIKILTPAFFARENTRTPMVYAGISAVINVTLGAALFFTVGFFGLALATTVAAWANVILLARTLFKSGHLVLDSRLKSKLPRIMLSSVIMAAGVYWLSGYFSDQIGGRGALHLGNYLGALKKFTALQHDYECLYCIVDLHAITVWQDPAQLKAQTREIAAAYLAAGVDPDTAIVYPQSMVREHMELAWYFNCVARVGWLNRMTQFKDKAGKNSENMSVGLYDYPVLQAADILLYKATFRRLA